jgi:hypothetical protein
MKKGDAVHQPTWPLLLKIEHMVKLQVFGNNSKTVSNIKNLTWSKNDQHILKKFTTDGRRRQVMRIAHMTLWVR